MLKRYFQRGAAPETATPTKDQEQDAETPDKGELPVKRRKTEERSQAAKQKHEESENGGELPAVSTQIRGKRATVVLSHGSAEPPSALLPSDVSLRRESEPAVGSTEPPQVWPQTVTDAKAAGLTAAAAWKGLGDVPAELESCSGIRSLLILGASGSGKSTLLRKLHEKLLAKAGSQQPAPLSLNMGENCPWTWEPGKAVIESFESVEVGKALLCKVGLSSVPVWLKPFEVLSMGEQHRANLAKALELRQATPQLPLLFDEFTSELDRDARKQVALALQRWLLTEERQGLAVGPCLLATCHEDVGQHFTAQVLCRCAVGGVPEVVQASATSKSLDVETVVLGNPSPPAPSGGAEGLIGNWRLMDDSGATLSARRMPRSTSTNRTYLHVHSGPLDIDSKWVCRHEKDGFFMDRSSEVVARGRRPKQEAPLFRMRFLEPDVIALQQRSTPTAAWGLEQKARRLDLPATFQVLRMAKDPMKVACTGELDYCDMKLDEMQSNGWYVPPHALPDGVYPGLLLAGPPTSTSKSAFRLHEQNETVEDGQCYLAAYVGERDGSLNDALRQAASLMDFPFDGLSLHHVHSLQVQEDLGTNFSLGVVVGRSGSGKSSIACKCFGPPPLPQWCESQPVVAHFPTLDAASEFCAAANLSMALAMKPHKELSNGEQSRATMARILAESQPGESVVLEEFASLVDKGTAKRMAAGLSAVLRKRRLQVVVVTPDRDLVGEGLLEPDWLFDCESSYLWRFAGCRNAPDLPTLRAQLDKALAAEAQTRRATLSHHFGGASCSSQLESKQAEVKRCKRELERAESTLQRSEQQPSEQRPILQDSPDSAMKRQLQVRRALAREWAHFRKHHYKDHTLKGDSACFVGLLDGTPVAFTAVTMESWNIARNSARKNGELPEALAHAECHAWDPLLMREHRTVVLPEYQGMGFGPQLCDAVAQIFFERGHDFESQSVHPKYGLYRNDNPAWYPLPRNGSLKDGKNIKTSHLFTGLVGRKQFMSS
mmetsp:Transcript_67218/g.161058  ORF Transcript_67218/g.161058 Transcript_67218/m.161058 type:complete len:1001 (-) Transcript_67218:35-3037(-)